MISQVEETFRTSEPGVCFQRNDCSLILESALQNWASETDVHCGSRPPFIYPWRSLAFCISETRARRLESVNRGYFHLCSYENTQKALRLFTYRSVVQDFEVISARSRWNAWGGLECADLTLHFVGFTRKGYYRFSNLKLYENCWEVNPNTIEPPLRSLEFPASSEKCRGGVLSQASTLSPSD